MHKYWVRLIFKPRSRLTRRQEADEPWRNPPISEHRTQDIVRCNMRPHKPSCHALFIADNKHTHTHTHTSTHVTLSTACTGVYSVSVYCVYGALSLSGAYPASCGSHIPSSVILSRARIAQSCRFGFSANCYLTARFVVALPSVGAECRGPIDIDCRLLVCHWIESSTTFGEREAIHI